MSLLSQMCRTAALLACLALLLNTAAGPVEFGRRELQAALLAHKPPVSKQAVLSELSVDPPESFRIQPGRVSGGDLRGLMYGLLEAAHQIRAHGRLIATVARPALPLRSLRLELSAEDVSGAWFASETSWREQFETMARARFNRLTLLYHGRNRSSFLHGVPAISRIAAGYALDLALAFRLDDLVLSEEAVPETAGPSALLAIKGALTASPSVRAVQLWVSRNGGQQYVAFCEEWLFRAVRESGRRITLEFNGPSIAPELIAAARRSDLPFRVGLPYHTQRPNQPAAVRPAETFWSVDPSAIAPNLSTHSTDAIRRFVQECLKSGCAGFEIACPTPPSGAGLRPFAPWARLGYDPKTTDAALKKDTLGL